MLKFHTTLKSCLIKDEFWYFPEQIELEARFGKFENFIKRDGMMASQFLPWVEEAKYLKLKKLLDEEYDWRS